MIHISKMLLKHICKLAFRAILLVVAIVNFNNAIIWIFWGALVIEMLCRIIPNKRVSIGARKHFANSYAPMPDMVHDKKLHKGAFLSAIAWFLTTGSALFILFLLDALTPAVVLIAALAFSVLDMLFIIFFCPFQKLFMQNHCCTECRIHNWDYFMMCAPLIIFPTVFSISLFILATAVLLRWEFSVHKNPHFFTRKTNKNLHCDKCEDKLCHYKRS